MQPNLDRLARPFCWLPLLVWPAVGAPALADVTVQATVSFAGGDFLYEISVDNALADDVVLVSLEPAPPGDAVLALSLSGPVGFGVSYDGELGIVDLIESSSAFGAGTVTPGFSFQSPADPQSGVIESFVAYTSELDSVSGPVDLDVPEPSTDASWLAAVATLTWLARRPRRSAASATA